MKRLWLFLVALCLWTSTAQAASWYVDNAAVGTNAGTSWADAWTSLATLQSHWASVNPGDTVYISGGTTTKTYNESFRSIKNGTSGHVITISAGQDANHNGVVIINPGTSPFLPRQAYAYLHITGNYNNLQHMQVTGSSWVAYFWATNPAATITSLRLSYIDFGQRNYSWYVYGSYRTTGYEFDHNTIEKLNGAVGCEAPTNMSACDSVLENIGSWNLGEETYDANKIHHNTFILHNDTVYGPDLIKWGQGISFYNNTVRAIPDGCVVHDRMPGTTSACKQHMDFMQLNKDHYKMYNNTFIGSADQGFFYSGYSINGDRLPFSLRASVTGFWIYNNLFVASSPVATVYDNVGMKIFWHPSGSPAGTVIQVTFNDVVIAHNTMVDMAGDTSGAKINLAGFAACNNCHIKNNLFKNSSGRGIEYDAGVSASNNSSLTSAVLFTTYTLYDWANNDFHLAASDTVAKDQGVDLSSVLSGALSTDKDGSERPVGAAWDIGAFEYGGQVPSPASAGYTTSGDTCSRCRAGIPGLMQ